MSIPPNATAGKFRKKPIVVEAFKWNPEDHFVPPWFADAKKAGTIYPRDDLIVAGYDFDWTPLFIKTLEGDLEIQPGDWVIQGVKGEIYPCKADIFEESYDAVVTDAS